MEKFIQEGEFNLLKDSVKTVIGELTKTINDFGEISSKINEIIEEVDNLQTEVSSIKIIISEIPILRDRIASLEATINNIGVNNITVGNTLLKNSSDLISLKESIGSVESEVKKGLEKINSVDFSLLTNFINNSSVVNDRLIDHDQRFINLRKRVEKLENKE